MKKILFSEIKNEYIAQAVKNINAGSEYEAVADDLSPNEACTKVREGEADAVIAGIDCSSRDVILAARDELGVQDSVFTEKKLFSSLFVAKFPDGRRIILGDGATCKHPDARQLAEIARLIAEAAAKLLDEEPRVAFLSFSTDGSGGHDETIDNAREAIKLLREHNPDLNVDGEMQLDAAIDERVGAKKMPQSPVAGKANVLIVPDINAGNILYKSLEYFAGAKLAGPILLGFKHPISDLSRGSNAEDVVFTAECLAKLL